MSLIWLRLARHKKAPLHQQIYRQIRQAILEGRLRPGSRLPATRTLAKEVGVSRNIAVIAFEQLAAAGYVESRVGAGTFVASRPPHEERPERSDGTHKPRPAFSADSVSHFGRRLIDGAPRWLLEGQPDHHGWTRASIDFRYGVVEPNERTHAEWRRCVSHAVKRSAVGYGRSAGQRELQEALADYLTSHRGVRCRPEQVIVVSGSQQALDLTAKVLIDPGDVVALEDPGYPGARQTFATYGATLSPVPVDQDGLVTAALRSLENPARLAYVTPSHQYPTGAILPYPRRLELLEWASRNESWVLEDDYDSEFRYEGRPVEAVQGLDSTSRTVYAGTLSKVLFPAIRLGYVISPPPLVEAFVAAKWLADRHTSTLDQVALAEFIETGAFERHLARCRKEFGRRREVLLEALERYLPGRLQVAGTNAGIHLVAWIRDWGPEKIEGLIKAASRRGVRVYSIAPCYATTPPQAGVLLGYASLPPQTIERGVRRLAEAMQDCV